MAAAHLMVLAILLSGPPDPPADRTGDALADPYVDGTYGFSIRPPKDWRLIRERIPEARGATLLRMVDPAARGDIREIRLKRTSTTKELPINEMLRAVAESLELEFSRVQILSRQVQQIAGHPAAYLSATIQRKGRPVLRLEAIVELAPRRYLLLLFHGDPRARDRYEPLFQRVVQSLRLLTDRLGEAKLKAALGAGAAWLLALTEDRLQQASVDRQYFQFELNGEPVGFVSLRERRRTKRIKQRELRGFETFEAGWMFEADGSVRRLQNRMFISADLQNEQWSTSVTTWWPAKADRPERLENEFAQGLRDHGILLSGQSYSLSRPLADNAPIKTPATYISHLLIRMLPRLLPRPAEPRLYAFTAFDHKRAGLIVRTVELKGKAKLPSGESAVAGEVYQIDEQEGLAGEPSHIYVDEKGRILLVKSGGLTLRPAGREELERRFGQRVSEADRAMARLERAYRENQDRFQRRTRRP